jgi:hypothetical protein
MARTVRRPLPEPPVVYDQSYIAQLAEAINQYMFQRTAPAEITAARFILVDTITVGVDVPDTSTLPSGMLYLLQVPGAPAGTYFLTVVPVDKTSPPPGRS